MSDDINYDVINHVTTPDPDDFDEDIDRCQQLGHQGEDIVFEDDEYIQWRCTVCGAEWDQEKD